MNIGRVITFFLTFSIGYCALGQKIKYKELFVLLNAKQYAEAEPFLKKYLKVTDDNPNAYLFMALIYQEKASKTDVLKQTEVYVSQLDSAVLFYGLANKGMTEKEVSKHDEYYQMYNRRDVRTGEFGVKVSDVLLVLEEGMKLKDRSKKALLMKSQLVAAEKGYLHAVSLFAKIQQGYKDLKHLYLQADDSLLTRLYAVATATDSSHTYFNDYKATAKSFGKFAYNQDLDPQEITDFKKEALPVDFYLDDIKVLDLKRWALGTAEVIEKEIKPLNDKLVAMDSEINKYLHQMQKDSVSMRTEIALVKSKTFPELVKIDPNPLPLQIFAMKQAELEFGSQVIEDRPLRDSLSIYLQINGLKKEVRNSKILDSITGLLVDRNLDEDADSYRHFVTTAYGTSSLLKTLIRSTKEFASREMARREAAVRRKTESLRWIVSGPDSIPLFSEVLATGRFKPLIIQEEKFTAGLVFADSIGAGYFYIISPSRRPDVKVSYPVNNQVFKKRYIPLTKALSAGDEKGLVFFVLTYLETKIKDKYRATLTKIYKVEGLGWSVNLEFDQMPIELIFSVESSELSIKTKSSIGEMFVTTIDRNGKPIK